MTEIHIFWLSGVKNLIRGSFYVAWALFVPSFLKISMNKLDVHIVCLDSIIEEKQ
jgi:hypothetical protein